MDGGQKGSTYTARGGGARGFFTGAGAAARTGAAAGGGDGLVLFLSSFWGANSPPNRDAGAASFFFSTGFALATGVDTTGVFAGAEEPNLSAGTAGRAGVDGALFAATTGGLGFLTSC